MHGRCMKAAAFLLAGLLAWPAAVRAEEVARTGRFAFHSDPWMNLHHFLYAWATQEKSDFVPRPHRRPMPDKADPPALAPDEWEIWNGAVAFYRGKFGARSLVHDEDLRALKRWHWDPAFTARTSRQEEVERVLAAARPVYEKHWWPEHDRGNRTWVDSILGAVARWEDRMVGDLARIYGGAWPDHVIRVDVTAYTDYHGAYNTSEPHVTIASRMDKNAFPHGVEIVFHETSHSASLEAGIDQAIVAAARAENVPAPRELWHALIFHTTGELARRAFAGEGRTDYVPYAVREGLYRPNSNWGRYKPLLDDFWLPALDGPPEARAAALRHIAVRNKELVADAAQKKAP